MSDSSSDDEAYHRERQHRNSRHGSDHRQGKRSHDHDRSSSKTEKRADALTESKECNEKNDDFISRSEMKKKSKSSAMESNMPPIPPPPKISKIQIGKPNKSGITMKLMAPKTKTDAVKKITVANAFRNDSDDDEVEEMPPECRMRMRNIGRDTPTSSGPNSFGKTKQGFIDSKKIFEKSLKEATVD